MVTKVSPGTMGATVLAIAAGLVGAYTLRAALTAEEAAPAAPPTPPRLVPIATADLPLGRVITSGDVASTPMTNKDMEERGLPLDKLMLATRDIIGRRLRERVRQGETFLTTDFYLVGQGPMLTERLKPGFRAVSLSIPHVRGGSVLTEMRVDVIFRSEPQEARNGSLAIPEVTVTIVQDAEVIHAYHPTDSRGSSSDPVITLAVTPEDASRLRAVDGRGDISLIPRPTNDPLALSDGNTEQYTLEDLLGLEEIRARRGAWVTEAFHRGRRQLNRFPVNLDAVEPDPSLQAQSDARSGGLPVKRTGQDDTATTDIANFK